ncbi:oligopeptide ABC transporter substrate-binding protein [Facklamia hominis]
MKKSFKKLFTSLLTTVTLSATVLSAATGLIAAEEAENLDFSPSVTNEGEKVEGATLNVALTSDTPFAGVLNNMLYSGQPDSEVINYFNPGLFGYDENFHFDESGFGKVELDKDAKTATITIPEGEKWEDGEPITIEDVIFPYYVIGHPDYTGIRYGSDYENIEGMEEYHNGEADEISGLEKVDDYTLVVHYKEFPNSMTQAGGGVSSYIEPKHYLEDIPVKDLEDSEQVRVKPIGFGPFKIESIQPGESVTYTVNEYYYKDRPGVDKVILKVVNPSSVVAELKAGNIDVASVSSSDYEQFQDAKNFTVLGAITNSYSYIGFKMGTWDKENGKVAYDPDLVTSQKALRQAMAQAIDLQAVSDNFYHGIQQVAKAPITPNFTEYLNPEAKAYEFNPEAAKQTLADAGFKDTDGDGFVEDPKGEKFKLSYAAMSGNSVQEAIAQYYIQSWQAVGIDIELLDGKLHEFNSFYERVGSKGEDDPAVNVYGGAWGMGGDPNPTGLYGPESMFNFPRWETDEHNEILGRINSSDSFDEEFRKQAFNDWQALMHEELPIIPTFWQSNLKAVNNRVSNWDIQIGSHLEWSDIYVTADKPITE